MDTLLVLKALSAFIFVVALMLLVAWVVRRSGVAGALMPAAGKPRRLKIVESASIDHRRRLVLVRRDDREHLLLLGPQGEVVVESGIIGAAGDDNGEQKHVQN